MIKEFKINKRGKMIKEVKITKEVKSFSTKYSFIYFHTD
jgi:hypothetical protein